MDPLRIGFASIYAWRPHTEHMMFLAGLAERAGHRAFFLACDSDLAACYTRELRDVHPGWMECLMCRAGGARSYPVADVASIGSLARAGAGEVSSAREWAASSASTLGRFESPEDFAGPEFASLRDRLAPPVARTYEAARAWIARERLDAVFVFNGRIDATRAIYEAARAAGIRVITFERTWFGDGIQLLPEENCLGLATIHRLIGGWSTRALTEAQARTAASYVAARLSGTNLKEWRAYNVQGEPQEWPVAGARRRILLLPGSLNEVWGDPGWSGDWPDTTAAYDALIAQLALEPSDLVLRCHPNWAERIGKEDGRRAEQHYTRWARARGIHVIASADRASTMSLIAQCDAVGLGSGSAAVEAAALGKQVISTASSSYQEAGFRTDATSPARMRELVLHTDLPAPVRARVQEGLRRQVLRYLYTMVHRMPQYVRHVKSVSTTEYRYVAGADPQRLVALIRTGVLEPDDATFAADPHGEDAVIARVAAGDWQSLAALPAAEGEATVPRPRRRWFLQPIDALRRKMPVGDRQ